MIRVGSRWLLATNDGLDQHELTVTVPIKTVSETNTRDKHWAARHRRRAQQRQVAGLVTSGALAGSTVTGPLMVVLTRLAPSGGLDDDNLVSSLKAIRDGVADALGIDDADARVSWAYDQRRAKRGQWAVEIRIVRGNQGVAA